MARRLFNLTAALSVVLCLAAGAASLRSHFASDRLRWRYRHTSVDVLNTRGRVVAWRMHRPGGELESFKFGPVGFSHRVREAVNNAEAFLPDMVRAIYRPREGFGAGAARRQDLTAQYVALPWWPVILVSAVPPARWVYRYRRRRRRRRQGRCADCGYDLRGSKDRCPECGGPIPATGATVHQPRSGAGEGEAPAEPRSVDRG